MPIERPNRFLLLYGSQTGQAQAIAEEIAEKAVAENLYADIHCLSNTEKKFYIERETCVVIVTSTTGDGEPPDTALKFFRRLRKKTLSTDYLSHLNYGLLGLGDSNYTNFCNCGKSLDKRLQDLGAVRFYEAGWADDAVGLEVVVEPWIDGLWAALKKFLNIPPSAVSVNGCEIIGTANDSSGSQINNKQCDTCTSDCVNDSSQSDCISNGVKAEETNMNQSNSSVTAMNKSNTNNIDINQSKSTFTAMNQSNTNSMVINQSNSDVTDVNQLNEKSNTSAKNQSTDTGPISKKDSNILNTNIKEDKKTEIKSDENSLQNNENSPVEKVTESVPLPLASVTASLLQLSESTLTVPVLSPPYLSIEYSQEDSLTMADLPLQNGSTFPSAASPVAMATIVSKTTLTSSDAAKKTLSVKLDISTCGIRYDPGDSFSVVCPNDKLEVDMLLERLGILNQADTPYKLSVLADTKKRNASLPKFVAETGKLRNTFTTCLDIRETPKKALLRVLVEYTTQGTEKRRLQELCSKQGASDYTQFVREPALSILDVLNHFPSCTPPVERLIEHIPRLQARPYSVCSSPSTMAGQLDFIFNVVQITPTAGRTYSRFGVCTGWLEQLSASSCQVLDKDVGNDVDKSVINQTSNAMAKLDISLKNMKIPVFARTSQNFHLPDDTTIPLILIGPGTGVAPFMGFLDHRAHQRELQPEATFGDVWLFYGCRHMDKDYLFKDKMENHLATSTITKLLTSFSRDDRQPSDKPRYVQDNIRLHGRDIVQLLDQNGAIVYVCGDAKNMAKDVNEVFIDIYSKEKGLSVDDARKVMMKLRLEKRYKEDVWT